ncbi:GntR family transcriptional regulator [Cellulomonas sp. DKR-3]|uniref:GntR family transcriptional regulator n=1 Tax=Cellulomonas fulva TaxID=2835530 RepID=A0ABS5U247_9CELL|nr:helix-turn-helix domain-containing protein [Cellulomonas fulva]MBT0995476.1 GntR family transcriptional regulator [Cellulomonas fulva]
MGNKSLNAFIDYEYRRVKGEPSADLFKALRPSKAGASAVTKRYAYERLLWHIKEKAGDRLVFPSQDTLAGTLAVDARSVRRALSDLEAAGLIYPGQRNDRTKGVTSTVYYVVDVIGERAALDRWKEEAVRAASAKRVRDDTGDSVPEFDDTDLRRDADLAVETARADIEAAHAGAYATDGRILAVLTGTAPADIPVYKSFRENAAAKRKSKGRIRDAAATRGVENPDAFAAEVVASLGAGAAQSRRAIDEFVNAGRLEELLPPPVEYPYLQVVPDASPDEQGLAPQDPPAWLNEDGATAAPDDSAPRARSVPMPPALRAQVDALRSA